KSTLPKRWPMPHGLRVAWMACKPSLLVCVVLTRISSSSASSSGFITSSAFGRFRTAQRPNWQNWRNNERRETVTSRLDTGRGPRGSPTQRWARVQSRIVHTSVWHAGLCLRALGRCTPGPVHDNPLRTRQPTRGAGPRTVKYRHAGIQLVTSRRAGIRLDSHTSIGAVQVGRVRRSYDAPASRLVHPELRSEEPFQVMPPPLSRTPKYYRLITPGTWRTWYNKEPCREN